jgi:glucose/arabinose dehydrogenase
MFLRISSAAILLALAACSKGGDAQEVVQVAADGSTEELPEAAASPASVPCALKGAKEFKADCLIERSTEGGKIMVLVRHPDGGFRRLIELDGGKRYAAADGAQRAELTANGKEVEVTVEDDHYLFPAPGTHAAKP